MRLESSGNSRSCIDLTASSRGSSPQWSAPSPSAYKEEDTSMMEGLDRKSTAKSLLCNTADPFEVPRLQIERSFIGLSTSSPESSSPTIYTPATSSSPASTPGSGKKRLRGGKYKAGSTDAWGENTGSAKRRDREGDDDIIPRRVLRPRKAKKKA